MDESIVRAAEQACARFEWLADRVGEASLEYERFCELAATHPAERLVPSEAVDMVWHEHMTIAGADGVTMHTVHSTPDRDVLFERTRDLYTETYGEAGYLWLRAADCHFGGPVPVDDEPDYPDDPVGER